MIGSMPARVRNLGAAVGALTLLLAPGFASACSVCMTGKEDDTIIAFELSTLFLTVFPLALIFGLLWWLRGRFQAAELVHEAAREAGASSSPSDSPVSLVSVER